MAAGTVIIRENVEDAPAAVNFAVIETPWSGKARLHFHEISEDDYAILKKYLLRREAMQQEEAQALEQKLVLFFSQKLGLKPEETGNPGSIIRYSVDNQKVFASVPAQIGTSTFVGEVKIEYVFKDDLFQMKEIDFEQYKIK